MEIRWVCSRCGAKVTADEVGDVKIERDGDFRIKHVFCKPCATANNEREMPR